MAGVRRHFSKEFKIGAIKLVTEQGYTIGEAAGRLDVDRACLYDWLGKYAPDFDATASAKEVPDDPKELEAELRRLRRDNERLRLERDILKKAAAYFAKDQL
jgi:transposase